MYLQIVSILFIYLLYLLLFIIFSYIALLDAPFLPLKHRVLLPLPPLWGIDQSQLFLILLTLKFRLTSQASGVTRKRRLTDTEEKSSHFQSQKGKLYEQAINKRRIQAEMQTLAGMYIFLKKKEDNTVLIDLRVGLALWVEPETGWLQPYEDINVKVSCYGDMCGTYEDILLFQVRNVPVLTASTPAKHLPGRRIGTVIIYSANRSTR
jgi:hypothetical protein